MSDKSILLDGKKLSEAEFLEKKKNLENKPGVKIIKVKENVYKTRLNG
jgi:hypothetical protein